MEAVTKLPTPDQLPNGKNAKNTNMTLRQPQSVIMTGSRTEDFAYAGAGADYLMREYVDPAVAQHALNSPARFNPYHNNLHTLAVAYHTAAGLAFDLKFTKGDERVDSAHRLMALGFLAGLYHDYGHSGGFMTDDWNVETAIKGFKRSPVIAGLTRNEIQMVTKAINTTVYMNGEFPKKPRGRLAEALRDADLMMIYDTNMHETLLGLVDEITKGRPDFEFTHPTTKQRVALGSRGEAGDNYDALLAWFFINNVGFLHSAVMYTQYGIMMRRNHLRRSLHTFKDFVVSRMSFRSHRANEGERVLVKAMNAALIY